MVSTVIFLLVLGLPFIIYLVNSGVAAKERRGIAAGIPKPKQPKTAKPNRVGSHARPARVRSRRVEYCGKGFTHFALGVFGSEESCRFCRYLQEVPGAGEHSDTGGAPTADPTDPANLSIVGDSKD
ncbi:MAG: hypothetical protein ABI577_04405 [bacterium]